MVALLPVFTNAPASRSAKAGLPISISASVMPLVARLTPAKCRTAAASPTAASSAASSSNTVRPASTNSNGSFSLRKRAQQFCAWIRAAACHPISPLAPVTTTLCATILPPLRGVAPVFLRGLAIEFRELRWRAYRHRGRSIPDSAPQ